MDYEVIWSKVIPIFVVDHCEDVKCSVKIKASIIVSAMSTSCYTLWQTLKLLWTALPVKNNYLETVMLAQTDGTMKTVA